MTKAPMRRAHFELIASIIKAMPTHAPSLRAQRESCARAFAEGLKPTCGGFKPERFLRACGMEEE